MSENPHISLDTVRALAEVMQLELTPTDASALRRSLSEYLGRVSLIRAIDPGDHEPSVITYEEIYGDETGE